MRVLWNDFVANFLIFLGLVLLFEIYLVCKFFFKIIYKFGDIRV